MTNSRGVMSRNDLELGKDLGRMAEAVETVGRRMGALEKKVEDLSVDLLERKGVRKLSKLLLTMSSGAGGGGIILFVKHFV